VKLAGLEKLIPFVEASIEQVKTSRVGENQLQVSTFSSDAPFISQTLYVLSSFQVLITDLNLHVGQEGK
jgi:hypothetical protein